MYYEELSHALVVAMAAHEGQERKFTGEPYFNHPVEVSDLVEEYMENDGSFTEEEILTAMTIAVLHDTVEDTKLTQEDIEEKFSPEVAAGVWFMTDPPAYVGNRKTRKAITRSRLSNAPLLVKLVKRFDLKHNTESIEMNDPQFYKVYSKERDDLMHAMFGEGGL